MKKNLVIACLIGVGSFVLGFECGGNFAQRTTKEAITKRFTKAIPLIEASISNMIYRAVEGSMSKEEIEAMLQDDLVFMKVVLDNQLAE
jgi:hypothetical protein